MSIKSREKYNWPAIRNEFLLSDYQSVKPFFEENYGVYNRHIATKTAGWGQDKEEWQLKTANIALDKIQDKEARELAKALNNTLTGLKYRVRSLDDMQKLTVVDLYKLWEIFMTMNGRSTKIATNLNFGSEKRKNEDELTDEEKIAIEKATMFIRQKSRE